MSMHLMSVWTILKDYIFNYISRQGEYSRGGVSTVCKTQKTGEQTDSNEATIEVYK